MQQQYPGEFLDVDIKWSDPEARDDILEYPSEYDKEAQLYAIIGQYSDADPKLHYIGMAYDQTVSSRINQADHKKRYEDIKTEYPRHKISVSFGTVTLALGNRTKKRIEEIESILIYTCCGKHSFNIKNFLHHGVSEEYLIRNHSDFHFFPKQIGLGVFVSND